MPHYRCSDCDFHFEIDWNRQTICGDCGSVEDRLASEDPDSRCGACDSEVFLQLTRFTIRLMCPKCDEGSLAQVA